jgi:hypothetical protein
LYVPTLDPEQQASCPEAQNTSFIPSNATHRADLPVNYEFIALAPWINAHCTLSFLQAASNDLLAGMLFYLPPPASNVSSPNALAINGSAETGNSTGPPPLPDDPVWALDGGEWKERYNFPVYAVPSSIGILWMQMLGAYSGNMTQVPEGRELGDLGLVAPTDYVRLMADISTGEYFPIFSRFHTSLGISWVSCHVHFRLGFVQIGQSVRPFSRKEG